MELAQGGMERAQDGMELAHDAVQEQDVAHTDLDDRVYGDNLFEEVPLFVLL